MAGFNSPSMRKCCFFSTTNWQIKLLLVPTDHQIMKMITICSQMSVKRRDAVTPVPAHVERVQSPAASRVTGDRGQRGGPAGPYGPWIWLAARGHFLGDWQTGEAADADGNR